VEEKMPEFEYLFSGLELQAFSGNCFCFADWGLISKENGRLGPVPSFKCCQTASEICTVILDFFIP
jgi:hypothetical protein